MLGSRVRMLRRYWSLDDANLLALPKLDTTGCESRCAANTTCDAYLVDYLGTCQLVTIQESTTISAGCSATTTCKTNGKGSEGVSAGTPCQFPFTYGGNTYSTCTTVDQGGTVGALQPWCFIGDGTKYGDCDCTPDVAPEAGAAVTSGIGKVRAQHRTHAADTCSRHMQQMHARSASEL